jgi:hypothetical protein
MELLNDGRSLWSIIFDTLECPSYRFVISWIERINFVDEQARDTAHGVGRGAARLAAAPAAAQRSWRRLSLLFTVFLRPAGRTQKPAVRNSAR